MLLAFTRLGPGRRGRGKESGSAATKEPTGLLVSVSLVLKKRACFDGFGFDAHPFIQF